jgi:maltose alpha-D-glucosyltransferase/alpha-amylase
VEVLGRRTAELHVVLASESDDPAFRPEAFSALYQRSLYQSVRTTVHQNLRLLARSLPDLPPTVRPAAEAALASEPEVQRRLGALLQRRLDGQRIRVHGDFHLGQVLHTGRDFMLIDFEGEPGRPLSERRLKRSALTDVSGMIRSFHYAASGSLLRTANQGSVRPEDRPVLEAWVRHWYVWASASFLRGYRETTAGQPFLPSDDADWAVLLDALLLQKAFYELDYELNNRPDWLTTPLEGISATLSG